MADLARANAFRSHLTAGKIGLVKQNAIDDIAIVGRFLEDAWRTMTFRCADADRLASRHVPVKHEPR